MMYYLILVRLLVLISWSRSGYCWSFRKFLNRRNIVKFHSTTITTKVNTTAAIHSHFMGLALEQARRAGNKGEVPIGAVIVARQTSDKDKSAEDGETFRIVAQAHNLVETRHDASAHAELLALQRAGKRLHNWRLLNTTLYTSLEPCPMCLAACQAFRVQSIVYAAPDLRLGAINSHMRLLDVPHPYHELSTVVPGFRENESADLLRDFFRQRRQAAKEAKRNTKSRWRRLPTVIRKRLKSK